MARARAGLQCIALLAVVCGRRSSSLALTGGRPQVCNIRGDRGRAEAAHLLSMLQGALLRAALSARVLGCPPKGMQAVAGACGLGAPLSWRADSCLWDQLILVQCVYCSYSLSFPRCLKGMY